MELNTILMESTFRLEGRGSQGTAFVLGRRYPKEPTKARYVVVTASHVLKEIQGESATIVLRHKTTTGKWERLPLTVKIRDKDRPLWTTHPNADVAVMYIPIPSGVIKDLLPTTLLADDNVLAEFEVHPGDELNCLGYPFGAEGNEAGFPILRSGKIASYPLLPTKDTRTFLFDFRVFGGNSGGPVYFVQSGRTYKGALHASTIQFIIGLVSQEVLVTQRITELYGKREQNYPLGLAEVVHASLIREAVELLPSPE